VAQTAMSEAARLVDQIQRAHDGDPWHGSPIKAILEGVTHEQATRRLPNGAHSIWELVLHMTGWRNEVARRATGEPAGEPAAGDWPAVGDPTAARWREALAALDASHQHLIAMVHRLSDERMLQATNDPRNRELGTGVSYYELLHGIVQHDAYHAGQISIVKKVLGI
jgi:uncharacterized damage-inducible protein DinB